MARKVALIPEELVSSYQLQKPEIRVEDDIVNLLEQGKLSDDMKVKLLSQLITRYHKIVSQPPEPVQVTLAEEEERKKLLADEKMDNGDAKGIAERGLEEIMISVPKRFAKFVPMIGEKLKTRGYHWNERGDMTKDGTPLKNIRIVDFFLYLFRNIKAQPELREFQIYLDAIREINVPRGWIGNKSLLKILNFNDARPAAAAAASAVVATKRKGRKRRSVSASPAKSELGNKSSSSSSSSPHSRSVYETPIKWGAKTIAPKEWKTY